MRWDGEQSALLSYISVESQMLKDRPLSVIRVMVDAALKELRPGWTRSTRREGGLRPGRSDCCGCCCCRCCTGYAGARTAGPARLQSAASLFCRAEHEGSHLGVTVFTKKSEPSLVDEESQIFLQQVVARAEGVSSAEHFMVDGT